MNSHRPRSLTFAVFTLLLASCLGMAGTVPSGAQQAPADIAVGITNPRADSPSFGEFEIEAEVYATEAIARVDFYVDGKLVGSSTKRPFRARVDVGYENLEHRYRAVAHGVSGATGEETLLTPAIAVSMEMDVELQQLYVTVQRGGRRDLSLAREDFRVLDGGEPQQIVTFERGEVPITAVVLLDTSESMLGNRLTHALEGAEVFVRGLAAEDLGMVLLFSDRLQRATPFSNEPRVLTAALGDARAEGGTAVNDHLYLALKRLEAQPGRPVVVLFSDGTDAHSTLPMESVLWKAGRSQALIYWILLEGEGHTSTDTISTAWRDGDANKEEVELLRRAVERSGGEVYAITRPEELAGTFRNILAELREQYVIGYYPSNTRSDGSWHEVKVDGPLGLRIRHRGGYVDD